MALSPLLPVDAGPIEASPGADGGADLDLGAPGDSVVDADRPPDLRPDIRRPPLSNRQTFALKGGTTGFSLEGQAQGTCATFTTREETQLGIIIYDFVGTISDPGSERQIVGTFTGSGPAGCTVAGEFKVTIR